MPEPALALNPEQTKYEQMWQRDEYRRYAPGEFLVADFFKVASPAYGSTIIDFGTGTGRGALRLYKDGLMVQLLDFADNCLDQRVRDHFEPGEFEFFHQDLTQPIPNRAEYGFCTDVMEHIAPEDVDDVIDNILSAAKKVYFQISLEHDVCGQLIGEDLHLTVHSMEWWTRKFRRHRALIYYSDKRNENAIFYVTKLDSKDTVQPNVPLDKLERNLRVNASRGLQQAVPHLKNNNRLILLAGGPSLNAYEDIIRAKGKAGTPIICTNGTYNWCLERDITPNGLIILDARAHNLKFISEVIPNCKYLLASQCHPDLFDSVPAEQTWIWHSSTSSDLESVLDEVYGDEPWYSIPGGITVTLRALSLLRMLGWYKMGIYGFDGCLIDDEHHAYEQSENDGNYPVKVTVGKREFQCHPWMAVQAKNFQDQYRDMKGTINISVHGDGLIAHLMRNPKHVKYEEG